MDRPKIYSQANIRIFDHAKGWQDQLKGFGGLAEDLFGNTNSIITKFAATQQSPASMIVNLQEGRIYQLSAIDGTAYSSLPANSEIIFQQGYTPAQTLTFNTTGLSSGQSKYALVVCRFTQPDAIRPDDPTDGVLGFFNAANPAQPLQGPGNSGAALTTVRKGFAEVSIVYGTAATTGSHTPPPVPSGYVPMYLVSIAFGQTTITSGQIQVSGPDAHPSAVVAPFAGGLYNHRHTGVSGQASLIDLETEVTGILPFDNLLMTSNEATGKIPNLRLGSGTPNGSQAGGVGDQYFQSSTNVLWFCVTAGNAGTAVWSPAGPVSPVEYTSYPLVLTQRSGTAALNMSASGNITLPDTDLAWELFIARVDALDSVIGTLIPASGQTFLNGATSMTINAGDVVHLQSLVGSDKIIILGQFKGGV